MAALQVAGPVNRTGRPPVALGVWPDMIDAARGVAPLALRLGVTPRGLRKVFTGRGCLTGSRAGLALAFAQEHGIVLRCYLHPTVQRAYLVSSPSGWWTVPIAPGGWARRSPSRRPLGVSWDFLPSIEVAFSLAWPNIA